MGCLEGRVAVVTGAGRSGSIGRAIAVGLAMEGANIVVNDFLCPEDAEATAQTVREKGVGGHVVLADVSKVSECRRLIDEAVSHFGRLDILVNNAGAPRQQNVSEITEDEWDAILDLFLKGPFFLSQAAAPHLLIHGGGRIINIASEQAYIGHPLLAHYTAAKAGIRTLTKSLALALAPKITVNTVCPGPTASERFMQGPEYTDEVREQIPLKRWGRPQDVAASVVFLSSPGGDCYTGQTLDPNCGTVMP